jgi:hypothetical protein
MSKRLRSDTVYESARSRNALLEVRGASRRHSKLIALDLAQDRLRMPFLSKTWPCSVGMTGGHFLTSAVRFKAFDVRMQIRCRERSRMPGPKVGPTSESSLGQLRRAKSTRHAGQSYALSSHLCRTRSRTTLERRRSRRRRRPKEESVPWLISYCRFDAMNRFGW